MPPAGFKPQRERQVKRIAKKLGKERAFKIVNQQRAQAGETLEGRLAKRKAKKQASLGNASSRGGRT